MERSVLSAAEGSLPLATEAIHAFFRLLIDRWAEDETLVVDPPNILEELQLSGWQLADDQVCFAISSWWRDEARKADHSPERDLVFPRIWKRLLPATVHVQDAKYYLMRSVRRRYKLQPSAGTVRALHEITAAVAPLEERASRGPVPYRDFLACTEGVFASETRADGESRKFIARHLNAFREVCWLLGHIRPAADGRVALEAGITDPEHLMSHLFGVPTGIPGFDELFGGGGLMLADSTARAPSAPEPPREEASQAPAEPDAAPPAGLDLPALPEDDRGIGGRVVLVTGPFGSGKSLLSLQMAVEVVRKGGVAWVMPLEQTPEECLYSLEAIGVSTNDPGIRVHSKGIEPFAAFAMPTPSQGALVFLRPQTGEEPDFGKFLKRVQGQLRWMSRYPLRLLVVDPVNALGETTQDQDQTLRRKTRAMFEEAKRLNVNVWFTSEQVADQPSPDRFEENVADTVIHLGVEDRPGGYRYIEITKSRFQQEYPGRHALVIQPRTGMSVYPSSEVISRSLRTDSSGAAEDPIKFGVTGMDEVLGPEPMMPGDLTVFAGPGKSKTLLGMQFLTADLENARYRSLLVSDDSLQRIDRFIAAALRTRRAGPGADQSKIVRCSIRPDFKDSSPVLLQIRDALEKCVQEDLPARRVLITNVSRWEKEIPMLSDDASFAIALARLLRSYDVAALIVTGDELEQDNSPMRQSLASQADFLVHFHHREFRGRAATLLTTIKSRLMRHPRESFELMVEEEQLRIGPAPLFRTNAAGESKAVRVVLYLHAETPNHQQYNDRVLSALRTTLSPYTDIARQSLRYDPLTLSMSRYSAVDELQVFQLDEFQLPARAGRLASRIFHTFDGRANAGVLQGRLPGMADRVTCNEGRGFFAVPFYQNVSFLAYRPDWYAQDLPEAEPPESWDELVKRCEDWEQRHPLSQEQLNAALATESTRRRKRRASAQGQDRTDCEPEVFFSCPVYEQSVETYNCMFMELLYTLAPPSFDEGCNLAAWLGRKDDLALQAATLFRKLCRRAHLLGFRGERRPRPIYSRHWYNTLNQELSLMSPEERSRLRVRPLFNGVTTAGDWYLVIPAQSASPDVGLMLMENLTAPEREMHRLQLGIGLPTRSAFYTATEGADPAVSPYFRFSRPDLGKLLDGAIRRSRFECYQRFASTISAHLQWILEIPENGGVETEIQRTLASLVSNIDFLRESMHCESCAVRHERRR